MNGYGKMTNLTHFNAIVGASVMKLRHRLTLHGATTKISGSGSSIGAGVPVPAFPAAHRGWDTRDNKVIDARAQPLAELFGSSDDLRADRECILLSSCRQRSTALRDYGQRGCAEADVCLPIR